MNKSQVWLGKQFPRKTSLKYTNVVFAYTTTTNWHPIYQYIFDKSDYNAISAGRFVGVKDVAMATHMTAGGDEQICNRTGACSSTCLICLIWAT